MSQAQLQDASHTLSAYLHKADLDPARLTELDERVSAWITLARRYRRQPQELPALLAQWRAELVALDAASDPALLEAALAAARKAFDTEAQAASRARKKAAPQLASAVTAAMQQLGMAGGQFDIVLQPTEGPQSYGARVGRIPRRRPCRQHTSAAGQGRVGWRAVAHRAGHFRDGQPGQHRHIARHADL